MLITSPWLDQVLSTGQTGVFTWRKVGPVVRVTLLSQRGDLAEWVTLSAVPAFMFCKKMYRKNWLAQFSLGRWLTVLTRTTFLHINDAWGLGLDIFKGFLRGANIQRKYQKSFLVLIIDFKHNSKNLELKMKYFTNNMSASHYVKGVHITKKKRCALDFILGQFRNISSRGIFHRGAYFRRYFWIGLLH